MAKITSCPFFVFFHFSDNPGQKLWQKPKISPSPIINVVLGHAVQGAWGQQH